MRKKIILMRNVKYSWDSVMISEDEDVSCYEEDSYVRLSEFIEVDFPELDKKTMLNSQVAVLDRQITKVRADAQAAETALVKRKQELLAITYDSVEMASDRVEK